MRRLFLVALVFACSGDDKKTPDASVDAGVDAPDIPAPAELSRFCDGRSFSQGRIPITVGKLSGTYKGALEGPSKTEKWKPGTLETIKIIPTHSFVAHKIRVNFARGVGTARLRLVQTFGRSYPGNYPSTDPKTLPDYIDPPDLMEPVDIDVPDGDAVPDKWLEVDVPDTILLPTQHYMLVYEHLSSEPYLAIEDVPATDTSRSLLFRPPTDRNAYGVPADSSGALGNYRIELVGEYVCAWSDQERWFAVASPPFADVQSGYVALSDLNGDKHDDVILTDATGGKLFFGDGKGGFIPSGFDPFPDSPKGNGFVFGDLDNDGDVDAFASTYVQTDGDGDLFTVNGDDCDDTDNTIYKGASEVPSNGKDDDCNGTADDGTSTADADGDGKSIAQGDCNDTRTDVHPGAPEILDGRDNDCNGKTDETFTSKILLNDSNAHFTRVASPDAEVVTSSTSVALGDGNGDGKVDVYAGSWLVHYPDYPTEPSRYYEGQGGGVMKDMLAAAGMVQTTNRPVYGVFWTDWNNDGKLDIYVSNYNLRDNILWKNMGGTFVDVAAQVHADHDTIANTDPDYPGGHSFGSDFGDINNDGAIDFFVPDISHPRTQPWADPSMLLVNGGAPNFFFTNKRHDMGIIYDEGDVNSSFADMDNDMDLDLIVIPTYPSHFSKLYRNDGDKFTDITYEANVAIHMSQEAVWGDLDEDGALDLIVTGIPPAKRATVFMNRIGKKNHWVSLDLVGTTTNKSAIGARVTLKAGGVTQTRDVGATSSHQSSHLVHFGLAANTTIESVSVRWIGGTTETITGATADAHLRIVEGSGKAVPR